MKTEILYKSLSKNLISYDHKWKIGRWYKIFGKLKICENGFHASRNIIDAMKHVKAEVLAVVQIKGDSIKNNDKECWSKMRLVKIADWNKNDSVSLAVFAAELVLKNYENEFPNDLRPRKAIEAAKKALENKNEENVLTEIAGKAAVNAAEAAWKGTKSTARAVESAVEAAWSAAWSKAHATESAGSAAESVVKAAESAAEAAWIIAWRGTQDAASEAEAAWSAAWKKTRSEKRATEAAWSAAERAKQAAYKKTLQKCHDFVLNRLGWNKNN